MPYVDTEWAVILEGALPSGEVWANRWTVQENVIDPDQAALTTAFRVLYISWAGVCHVDWTCTSLTYRNLVTGTVITPTFALIQGEEELAAPLPTECALRVSLSAAPGRHGGPFLAGVAADALDENGQMSAASLVGFSDALEQFFVDADAAGYNVRLDSPTDVGTKELTQCRIGRTFDVIRRRRNQVAEGFINIPLP